MFYDDGNIKVDNTRYMIGNKTIPISSISSVEPTEQTNPDRQTGKRVVKEAYIIPGSNKPLMVASFVFIFCIIFLWSDKFHWLFYITGSAGLALMSYELLKRFSPVRKPKHVKAVKKPIYESVPNNHHVTITTAGGESSTYQSTDKEKILKIVEAINQAIIAKG
jgi:hypothetical protein